MERQAVLAWLKPQSQETIVDFGGGTGYIAEWLAPYCKKILVLDPAIKLLRNVPKDPKLATMKISENGLIPLPSGSVDAIFTMRAIHHVRNYHTVFSEFYRILKDKGRLLICDIYEGSLQAKHFDAIVSLYCKAGHHRAWLNPEYLKALCKKHGFLIKKCQFLQQALSLNQK